MHDLINLAATLPLPCEGGGTVFGAATSGEWMADVSVGVFLEVSHTLPRVAGALRGAGGAFAVAGLIHGIRTRNYVEAGFGALDIAATVASIFPPADFITGPYFAGRIGMGLAETADYLLESDESRSVCVN